MIADNDCIFCYINFCNLNIVTIIKNNEDKNNLYYFISVEINIIEKNLIELKYTVKSPFLYL